MVNLTVPFHPMKFAHTTWYMHTYGGKIILSSEWEPRKYHLNRPGSCGLVIHRSSFATIFLLMRRKLHCELTQFLEALSIQSLCLQEMKGETINRWLSPKTSILCFFCGIMYLLGMISTPHERKHKTFALDTKMLIQYPTWESLTIWAFCDISHM